ncbi:MAG: hypothetical protein RI947_948 [Candidatus Parcubacteria bacterium]
MKKKNTSSVLFKILVCTLFLIGFALRLYNQRWDNGLQIHPDERAITMFAEKIHFFDQLDPDFFSYGSLPIYLLKALTQFFTWLIPTWFTVDAMYTIGRTLSVIFDMGTAYLLFVLVKKISNKKIAVLSLFFYVMAFFPIQNSHFYIVDVQVTFYVTLLLTLLLRYIEKPTLKNALLVGIVHGLCLAVKITPVIFVPFIIVILLVNQLKKNLGIVKNAIRAFKPLYIYVGSIVLTYLICVPYSILNHTKYIHDMTEQLRLNSNPYEFPFTLQYVDTTPYIYYFKNIILWGAGPIIAIMAFLGICIALFHYRPHTLQKGISPFKSIQEFVRRHYIPVTIALFYAYYVLIIGRSAVKFMRYMLPVYPFIALMAAIGFYYIFIANIRKLKPIYATSLATFAFIVLSGTVVWTATFMSIYTQPLTRLTASYWINSSIPKNSVLTYEGWDDGLPLMGSELFQHEELALYGQPDDAAKWTLLHAQLAHSDYVILSSNRLYVPIQRLNDCTKYKNCFPIASIYYKKLLANKLETREYKYKKIAEFAVYPTVPFSKLLFGKPIYIDDQSADESFTVYDHPKVLIFKNIKKNL